MRKFQSQYNRHKLLWAWKCQELGTLGSRIRHTTCALALSTLSSQEIVCQLDHFNILLATFHQSSRLCKVANFIKVFIKTLELEIMETFYSFFPFHEFIKEDYIYIHTLCFKPYDCDPLYETDASCMTTSLLW